MKIIIGMVMHILRNKISTMENLGHVRYTLKECDNLCHGGRLNTNQLYSLN